MSRIQKALQILQHRDAESTAAGKRQAQAESSAATVEDRYPSTKGRIDRHGHGSNGHQSEFFDAEEYVPQFNLEVSVASLVEQGIQLEGADLELINQQFRRIKRPVLNTAFGDGLHDSQNANVIMMASALPQSGKTFCSFNLATSIAREKDVGSVLVDADVLKPNISRALGIEDRIGLIDYLVDDSISIDDILVATDLFGIIVVPAGRQHDDATELLASRRMTQFIALLSEKYRSRAIIVDTPPLLITNEAQVLAQHMGQIVMVIEAGRSNAESILQALESLDRSKPINAILNKAPGRTHGGYGGYGDYGDYSAPQRGNEDEK